GWRKNIIMNQAVRQAASGYLIFIDGDCIPHRNFIREHIRNRQSGIILSGRRINLSEKISDQLTPEKIRNGFLEKNILTWLLKGISGEITHAEKGLYLPWLRLFLMMKRKDLLGANFSISWEDLYRINGFDERYLAPTVGEDTDIEYRAGLAGIGIRSIRNLAVQYHLHHKLLSRKNNNYLIFEETRRNKVSFTPYGLLQEMGKVS
ncbi:MAG: Chondroitin polymerase, partial [Cyclobacteriaceae bacterium]|nr:Chondroitin polymerase [Cyclobacteriaceae bacterium]